MPKQFLELIDGVSSKFWHAELNGDTQSVRYGRIGTEGRETTNSFTSPSAAKLEFEKLVQQKVGKGYVKVTAKRAAKHIASGTTKSRQSSAKKTKTTKPTKKAVAKSRGPNTGRRQTTETQNAKPTQRVSKKTAKSKPGKLDIKHLLTLLKKKARGADEMALKKKLKAASPKASKSEIMLLAGKWEATEVVKSLADANVDFNSAAGEKFYTFNAAITKLVLESGYNAKKFAGRWLQSAVTHGKTPIVRLLLDCGVKATPTGPKSISLLSKAIENNRMTIAQHLLEAGANVNKPSYKGGDSPLMKACKQCDLKTVELLLNVGADVGYQDEWGFDALMTLVGETGADSLAITKLLLSKGADVNRQLKKSGWTPLMMAASHSNDATVKFLLKQGADAKCATKMGTPLTSAARMNNAGVVPTLLKAGVDPNWKYGPKEPEHLRGRNALDVARESKARRVIPLLENATSGRKGTSGKPTKPKIGTVAQSWKRIETWLKANDPERFKSLAKPANAASILKLEKATGCKLPTEVVQSYKIHDGQKDYSTLAQNDDGGYTLLPVKEMLGDWKVWDDLIKYGEFEGDRSQPAKGIRGDKWFNLKWIPFMSNGGGDSFCIDLDPDQSGKIGQIITMNHEHGRRDLLAPSIKDFLGTLAHDLENGLIDLDED